MSHISVSGLPLAITIEIPHNKNNTSNYTMANHGVVLSQFTVLILQTTRTFCHAKTKTKK